MEAGRNRGPGRPSARRTPSSGRTPPAQGAQPPGRTPPPRRPLPPRRKPPSGPPPRRNRAIAFGALGVGLLAIVVVAVLVLTGGSDDTPSKRLDAFLTAWTQGDDAAAARATDAPAAALAALKANRAGLDGAAVRARSLGVEGTTGRADVAWQVPAIGSWSYATTIPLHKTADGWKVAWAPSVVSPALGGGQRLGTIRTTQTRGRILDRNGVPLVTAQPVKRVGVVAGDVQDPAATAAAVAQATGIDAKRFEQAIRNGGRQQFVEAITLRPSDYANVSSQLSGIAGVQVIDGTAQLAPTKAFARQLLGGVGELSAQQLKALGPGYEVGDVGGQWGLEAKFESQLAGTPTRAIVVRASNGSVVRTLQTRKGTPGRDLKTLLDGTAQTAAESALGGLSDKQKAALVVVKPSTGDVLAVANRPTQDTFDRALEGRYPPGSTFKIVTTDALLEGKVVTPDATVGCPTTVDVGGRSFKNFEGGGGGSEPFSQAFAQSCNTAFVPLASKLAPDALTQAGARFGIGSAFHLPLSAYGGQVPQPADLAARAAAMIGQDKVLVSPLGMAELIATVASGRFHAPRLLPSDPKQAGAPLDATVIDDLRTLTRLVVTSGTGTALAGTSGDVHGKSGTAEYGSGNPPPTHAWFIAYRGDVAVAAIVEGGRAGGEVAAPLVAQFLSALDSGTNAAANP